MTARILAAVLLASLASVTSAVGFDRFESQPSGVTQEQNIIRFCSLYQRCSKQLLSGKMSGPELMDCYQAIQMEINGKYKLPAWRIEYQDHKAVCDTAYERN